MALDHKHGGSTLVSVRVALLAIGSWLVLATAPVAQAGEAQYVGPDGGRAFQVLSVGGDVYVNGYYRKDGTYVQPHYRSAPDGNPYNNYSFPGNVNPYTGERATGNPNTYLKNYSSGGLAPNGSGMFGNQQPQGSLYGNQPLRGLYGN